MVFKIVIAALRLREVGVGDVSAQNKFFIKIILTVGLYRLVRGRVDNNFRRYCVVHKGVLPVIVLADAFILAVGITESHGDSALAVVPEFVHR